jgi:hypothetical protein
MMERSKKYLPKVHLKQVSGSQKYPSRRVDFHIKNVPTSRISFSEKPEDLDRRAEHFIDMYQSGKTIPPILVHKLPDGKYEVLDGHARLEAYRRMGIEKIPVVENLVGEILGKIGASFVGGVKKMAETYKLKREEQKVKQEEELEGLKEKAQKGNKAVQRYLEKKGIYW